MTTLQHAHTNSSSVTTPLHRALASGTAVTDRVASLARRIAPALVRYALATLMLWFGVPKLFPGGSPAEDLAVRTVEALTGGLLDGTAARLAIGGLEIVVGVLLVLGRAMPFVLLLVLGHMAGTFTPLVLFPAETWHTTGVGTLEGQYIIKNIVIIAGVVVLAGWGMNRKDR